MYPKIRRRGRRPRSDKRIKSITQMANVSLDLVRGDKTKFRNILSSIIEDISSNGASPADTTTTPFKSVYRESTHQGNNERELRFSKFFGANDSDIFNIAPKKAAKKFLKEDNWIKIDNDIDDGVASVESFVLDAGRGDDIIDYAEDGHTGSIIKGGQGDDLIKISVLGNHPAPSELDAYISTAPRAVGGKGNDIFTGYGPIVIDDYEVGKDVIAVRRFNAKKQKPIHKTAVVDGSLYIFDRKSMELNFLVRNISDISSIDFISNESLYFR